MVEKTNIYFLAEITKNYGNGDCILLENIDNNGNIIHALIDTGRKAYNGVVCKFLKKHNVKKLEFLLITHSHGDHNGDTISVIDNYEIDTLIMKEYDRKWSPDGTQKPYEDIIIKAIQKKIKKILGVSYLSLISEEYSPSRSGNFKKKITKAKKENFEYFNQDNVNFRFGSAYIQVLNWEIFDSEGNLFVTGQNNGEKKIYRDIYATENENSMGVLLTQGNKRAFFAGDMNNTKKKVGNTSIGDEDRLKNIIGKIDFLKLGHHGYNGSNTIDYLNVLNPQYAVITNDVGEIFFETNQFLEKNNVNFLYSTQDIYEVNAVITNNDVELGFGTKGFQKIKDSIYYINEENIYKNYLNCKVDIQYNLIEQNVQNWEELKNIIEKNKSDFSLVNSENKNLLIFNGLKIYLLSSENNNCYLANSCIVINDYQKILLTTKEKEIIIKRDKSLVDFPLFFMENGYLTLGEEKMNGKIIIDGNKDEVLANSNLIKLITSEFSMYNNTFLRNNYNKTTRKTKKAANLNANKFFGSAIYAFFSKINIFGGEISNNIHEIYIDEKNKESKLPEVIDNEFLFIVRGVGIYMNNKCILNMYGGKITKNKGINNSYIYTNINSSNLKHKKGLIHQNCQGIGIYSGKHCEIYLHKGEISNNISTNNGKISLITPKDNKKTKLFEIFSCIYGTGLFLMSSKLEMLQGFIIKNNFSELKTNINIEKNCFIEKVHCAIRGGQIYSNNSIINIKGGLIQNSLNITKITTNIFNKEEFDLEKKLITDCQGGGISCINCTNIEINNLKIEKCNADKGGAIFFNRCNGIINDSIFESNFAKEFGGALFIYNANSDFQLLNNKILNNIAEDGGAGGIFAFGKILIDGINTLISDNFAGKYGGGIIIKNYGIMKNGKICHNKAYKNSGGGIRIDGIFELINGKICKNWANGNGGGISFEPAKKFIFDKKKIRLLVYKNIAKTFGNDIYPLKSK